MKRPARLSFSHFYGLILTLSLSSALETSYHEDLENLYTTNDEIAECTSDKKVIEKLDANYTNFKLPSESCVHVWIEVWIQEVTSINEILGNFEMEIYITEKW